MDNFLTIKNLAQNWHKVEGYKVQDCPPEARVITGRMIADGQYHYFEQASGVRLEVVENQYGDVLTGYEIVDEKLYMMFVLRYS